MYIDTEEQGKTEILIDKFNQYLWLTCPKGLHKIQIRSWKHFYL